jgi:hypothetical protein
LIALVLAALLPKPEQKKVLSTLPQAKQLLEMKKPPTAQVTRGKNER